MTRRPYWPWGVGLDKRQARRLRRRLGRTGQAVLIVSTDDGQTWHVAGKAHA